MIIIKDLFLRNMLRRSRNRRRSSMRRFEDILDANEANQAIKGTVTEVSADVIGRGGFGTVYKGVFSSSNGKKFDVAIKQMRIASTDLPSQILDTVYLAPELWRSGLVNFAMAPKESHRFFVENEISVLAKLRDCKFVTKYFGHFEPYHQQVWLVLELCRSKKLMEYVTPLELEQRANVALFILAAMSKALQAVHELDYVHRDLKPDNILIGFDGMPKLADFGITERMRGHELLDGTGTHAGTPPYAAPELVVEGNFGKMADLWGLGVCCKEILSLELHYLRTDWNDFLLCCSSWQKADANEKDKIQAEFIHKFGLQDQNKEDRLQVQDVSRLVEAMVQFDARKRASLRNLLLDRAVVTHSHVLQNPNCAADFPDVEEVLKLFSSARKIESSSSGQTHYQ